MTSSASKPRNLRLTPLSTCLALVLAGGVFSQALADGGSTVPKQGSGHVQRVPYQLRTLSSRALRQAQHPSGAPHAAPLGYVPKTTAVGSCADDGGPTTLRSLVAAATSGDTIDLSALACSSITLTTGQITISVDDLTLVGPSDHVLSIDANHASSVLFSYGHGTLALDHLAVTNGSYIYPNGFAGGAGIGSFGSISLTNSSVTNCYANSNNVFGAAVDAAASLTLLNSSISNNIGKASFTAAKASSSHPSAPAATTLNVSGGGAYAGYGLTMTNSTVSGNQAIIGSGGSTYGGYAFGGGIFLGYYAPAGKAPAALRDVSSTISGSTIDNNSVTTGGQANSDGGAIYLHQNSLTLTNSTVSGNSSEGFTGGIEGYNSTGFSAYNSTIALNTASQVGGVYLNLDYAVAIHSSIIAGNSATDTTSHAADLAGGLVDVASTGRSSVHQTAGSSPAAVAAVSDSNNLITSHDAAITLTGTVLTGNPLLSPLANNGGLTRTHALGAGSPALNTGDNLAGLTTDQRGAGFLRVVGAASDIGAFETQAVVVTAPVHVPSLSAWMLGVLSSLLAAAGLRRGQRVALRTRK